MNWLLLLATLSLPDSPHIPLGARVSTVASARLAYLVSGIPEVQWVALAYRESRLGTDTRASSSAQGPWQVIARHAGIRKGSALAKVLGRAPVNAVAAGVVARGFQRRCGQRWPACYNEGWQGRHEGSGDGFLADVRRYEETLRRATWGSERR